MSQAVRVIDVSPVVVPELHEFMPYPVTAQDKPGHVCNGGCACATCSLQKGERAAHYQTRDRRRPKVDPRAHWPIDHEAGE